MDEETRKRALALRKASELWGSRPAGTLFPGSTICRSYTSDNTAPFTPSARDEWISTIKNLLDEDEILSATQKTDSSAQAVLRSTDKNLLNEHEILSATQKTDSSGVTIIKKDMKVIDYYYLDEKILLTRELEGKLSVIFTVSLMDKDAPESPTYFYEIVGYYLSILLLFCRQSSLISMGVVKAWQDATHGGFDLVGHRMTLAEVRQKFDHHWPDWTKNTRMGPDNTQYTRFFTIAITVLLLLFKKLPKEALDQWFLKRCSSFIAFLDGDFPEKFTPPPYKNVLELHSFINFNHEARKSIFSLIRAVAKSPRHKYSKLFKAIIRNMWYTEMRHINMIDQYIIKENPELLNEVCIGEINPLIDAYSFIKKFSAEDRPFLKIILSQKECSPLFSKNFIHLAVAARTIAKMEEKNIGNIMNEADMEHMVLIAKVITHITTKSN